MLDELFWDRLRSMFMCIFFVPDDQAFTCSELPQMSFLFKAFQETFCLFKQGRLHRLRRNNDNRSNVWAELLESVM